MVTLRFRDRYAKLVAAGFQIKSCEEESVSTLLFERWGGHFVEIGTGIQLIETKKVGIRSGVSPEACTASGLRLSDGSTLDADAIIWCTGFKDADVRTVIVNVLGEGGEFVRDRMEATFGVDFEGEIRGMWKRHAGVESFYVIGAGTGFQRWFSKLIALQIKAALEGILPEAHRHHEAEME
jgi:hypothetical protein